MRTSTPPDQIPIRQAQTAIIEDGLALPGPDTDLLRKNPAFTERGGGEFAGPGLRRHGEVWFEVLAAHIDKHGQF